MATGWDWNSIQRNAGSCRELCRRSADESAYTNEPLGEDRC